MADLNVKLFNKELLQIKTNTLETLGKQYIKRKYRGSQAV